MFSQKSFDPLELGSPEQAKKARDSEYKHLTIMGCMCKRWVLKNQLRQYESFGVPDGRIRDVYMLNIIHVSEELG